MLCLITRSFWHLILGSYICMSNRNITRYPEISDSKECVKELLNNETNSNKGSISVLAYDNNYREAMDYINIFVDGDRKLVVSRKKNSLEEY